MENESKKIIITVGNTKKRFTHNDFWLASFSNLIKCCFARSKLLKPYLYLNVDRLFIIKDG